MHRSALLIIAILACSCTKQETHPSAESTASAQTAPTTANELKSDSAPTAEAADKPSTKTPAVAPVEAPATERRNPFRVPPEYREAQALYNRARRALDAGDKDSAAELLDRVLALRPDHARAVRDRLALLREHGKYHEALVVIDQALAKNSRIVSYAYERALTQFQMGDTNGALTALADLIKPEKRFPAARLLQMKALATLGDTEATLTALEAAADAGFTDISMIEKEPLLQPLEGESRFKAAIASMERTKRRGPPTQDYPVLRDFETSPGSTSLLAAEIAANRSAGAGHTFNFSTTDLDGKPARLADYGGRPLIVCTWGTWSVSSWKLFPHLVELKKTYKEANLEVLLLGWENQADHDAGVSLARKMLAERKVALRSAVLTREEFGNLYIRGCPSLYFIEPGGKVAGYALGYMPFEDLKTLAEALIGKE